MDSQDCLSYFRSTVPHKQGTYCDQETTLNSKNSFYYKTKQNSTQHFWKPQSHIFVIGG